MSYGIFADYYDIFTANVDYHGYALRIDEIVKSLELKRGSLVDLGCGTASLSLELAALGYFVTGIDLSCDMLTAASAKLCQSEQFVTLVNQDMTDFRLPEKADVIISTLDGLNHLDGIDSIKSVFQCVKRNLKRGGAFIFDMNTVYKHREVLGNNSFIFDSDEAYLGWQNDYSGEGDRVDITLDFFIPEDDGSYSRYTEQFSELAYPADKIKDALAECGLRLAGMYDGLSQDQPGEKTQRILFAALN